MDRSLETSIDRILEPKKNLDRKDFRLNETNCFFMNYRMTSGIIILVIDLVILFYRRDIFFEIFRGTAINEIDISKLLLPTILLVVSLFLILNKKKNNEPPKNNP